MQDTNKYKVYKAITAVGKWLLFAIVSFLILFPVLWIFVSSITPPGELFKMPIDYIPDHPTLASYKFLIENVGLLEKIGNTVLIVGVTIVVSTVICAMAAYGFSRFRTKGISIAFAFIIATMLIPEVVTARPLYDFMRAVGLYDTYPGLIILYISAVIPFIHCIDLKELCIRDSDFPGRSSNHRRSEFCPEIIQSGLTTDETCNRYSLYH